MRYYSDAKDLWEPQAIWLVDGRVLYVFLAEISNTLVPKVSTDISSTSSKAHLFKLVVDMASNSSISI